MRPNKNYFGPSDCIHWSLLAKAVAYLTTVQSILLILAISLIWDFFVSKAKTRRKPKVGSEMKGRKLEFIKRMDSLSDNENI